MSYTLTPADIVVLFIITFIVIMLAYAAATSEPEQLPRPDEVVLHLGVNAVRHAFQYHNNEQIIRMYRKPDERIPRAGEIVRVIEQFDADGWRARVLQAEQAGRFKRADGSTQAHWIDVTLVPLQRM